MAGQRKVHGLNPNAIRSAKSLGDATGLTQMGVHLVTILPGHDSTEYHRHLYEEEFVYILSGRGSAEIDGKMHAVAAGDFLGFPRGGVAHGMSNTGTEPLVCLVGGQRLEQDVCDYPHQNKRLYINGTQEDMVDTSHVNT
ncbi:MAG: cupin domain-containing protein [Pseudomonadota bacterium]